MFSGPRWGAWIARPTGEGARHPVTKRMRLGEMDMTCHKCGYKDSYTAFAYLCKNGCPACGESDLRRCPKCGAQCVFSRAEALEGEEREMEGLVGRLMEIHAGSTPEEILEAKRIMARLSDMNNRWNLSRLRELLILKQKEFTSQR